MIKKLNKEQKNRQKFSYAELDKLCVKILKANIRPMVIKALAKAGDEKKILAGKALKNLCYISSILERGPRAKVRNRCLLTNRSKAVYKKWGVSRNKMHEMLKFGIIPGSRKSVW